MELDKIYQLMDKFEQSSLTSFEYRDQDFEIQMGKKSHNSKATTASSEPAPLPNQPVIDPTPVTPTPIANASAASVVEPTPTATVTSTAAATPTSIAPESTPEPEPAPTPEPAPVQVDPKECVTAPVVGIYYPAHSSEEAPYVKLGDHVSVGQQVGLIQAMQMMRPVVAKQAGTVKAFLVKNGEEVNFGQPLIQLIPDTPDDI
ncbi:acetyl-CoA carboxylase biotin carboxyl carrier protein subunit [Lactiplantibacillus pentosus]|uniref:Biotin carboxyl carrier protein of acetyl-CoA carboxylase n=1 Tax=Lactiplantibacillus pentosus IG1 TaxID=1042160 RepID=G0M3M4_LACPE|nr:biotin/lipoyl-containing protein [Lactiplantibacillus pentosus]CCC16731.1 acetyl-CoA carboxylase, biotin carboxyl carrier protein [Lactiplantibacillus pentosus IG1]MCT3282167.1 acetyl-CoA carboxylase biotin carboxyl carrier protein subunit [Lactiplantibacillus pentosus]MCT3302660.1 acetyl-CoA carboxylase biotin carboxyl carrier protein subunit [Lactiplantibacillus pentosus]PRO80313.1 acetyl-CoA carboxylase biotin carboxyl carrier protein subunit [Lactiplantibacillus pentosus]PRO83075.1 acet